MPRERAAAAAPGITDLIAAITAVSPRMKKTTDKKSETKFKLSDRQIYKLNKLGMSPEKQRVSQPRCREPDAWTSVHAGHKATEPRLVSKLARSIAFSYIAVYTTS